MALNQDEPPPSTLAAHILRNGVSSSTQRDAGVNDHFTKLLLDFLNDPVVGTGEDNLEDNHRFVVWLTDATVESCKTSEPFTPSRSSEQAAGCLKCICFTIDKHPEVLQYNGSSCSKNSIEPPLSLKVTARLLSVA